ncbi:MFS transporter [Paenisporosarcina sp.]|uniref:MFS transporter n=1 Tax=Paenisporosarcina sp. TaxID=1932001 RepID=UPI003C78DB41
MKVTLNNEILNQKQKNSIWKNKNFTNLLIGGGFSVIGYRLYSLIMSWFVIELTGSTSILGMLFVFWAIPNMFFMIAGGAISDNFDKVKIMWFSDISRAIVLTVLLVLYLFNLSFVYLLFIISLIFGISNAMFTPARDALVPEILDSEDIQKGNSMRELINQLAIVLGPLIGALAIEAIGVGEAFIIPVFFMLFSAVFIKKITYKRVKSPKKNTKKIFKEIKEGYKLVKSNNSIVFMFICMAIFNFGYFGPMVIGLPYLSNVVLDSGIGGFTFLEISIALGMIIGSIICSKINMKKVGVIVYTATIISGLLFSVIGFISKILLIGLILFIIGCLVTIINILMYSTVQKAFDVKVLGIVFGFLNFIVVGLDPISFFISGIAFDIYQVELVFLTGGLLIGLAGVIGVSFKSTRQLKTT